MIARLLSTVLAVCILLPATALADKYVIDTKGAHAFIQFKIQHLGYSWLLGRFNDFSGEFTYDEDNPNNAAIMVDIDPASIDSNHAERDKHLRGKDFLHVDEYPEAKFVSTQITDHGDGTLTVVGDLTLRGQTQEVTIDAKHVGHGPDPWGGYRRGFEGTTELTLKEWGIDFDLGPAARDVIMELHVEGIRQ